MADRLTRASKFLSYVLRHDPRSIGLALDGNGWAGVDKLLAAAGRKGQRISRDLLEEVVRNSPKQRFELSDDGRRIRANYGHSLEVDLSLKEAAPPTHLYHGTATRFLSEIMAHGLTPQDRQYVHLSQDEETAVSVGRRHGEPIVLTIDAAAMHDAGYTFYRSTDRTWLTDSVPAKYIEFA